METSKSRPIRSQIFELQPFLFILTIWLLTERGFSSGNLWSLFGLHIFMLLTVHASYIFKCYERIMVVDDTIEIDWEDFFGKGFLIVRRVQRSNMILSLVVAVILFFVPFSDYFLNIIFWFNAIANPLFLLYLIYKMVW